jgi:endonuclease/exonuclease/phosphatase family metal-dependent hydrolase
LKVLSWNIAMSRGTDNVLNLDRTATWIANLGVDIAALCEVTRFSGDDQVVRLVNLLTQKTGRTWHSHFVAKYPGCLEGNLIVSKLPFSSVASRFLSYERSIAQVTISVNGRNVNFFATHLDHISSSLRATQVSELTSWASGFAEPRIICGDFNAGPDTSEISGMISLYYDSWTEAMSVNSATAYPDNPVQMHTRTRRGRIDYVYYSRGASVVSLLTAQIPDSRDLSNPNVAIRLGNADDLGVRPSDHNHMVVIFDVR